jgi:hypothetical protein
MPQKVGKIGRAAVDICRRSVAPNDLAGINVTNIAKVNRALIE